MGIGARIKTIAKNRGITLRQVAENAGISYNTLYSITKRDSERIQGDILVRISSALGVSPSDLLDFKGGALNEFVLEASVAYPDVIFSRGDNEHTLKMSVDDITPEKRLLGAFRMLNEEGRKMVTEIAESVARDPKFQRQDTTTPSPDDSPTDDT